MNIIKEIEKRTHNYPYRSQEEKTDPLIVAKLFDTFWSATWYISEYDPKHKVIFSYVEWLSPDPIYDEWGSASLEELQALQWWGIPRIECDLFFQEIPFSQLKIRAK